MNSIRTAVAVAALSLVVACSTASAYVIGEPYTNPTNNNRYVLVTASEGQTMSWDTANQLAIAQGGHLLTIEDAAELQWVLDTFGATNRAIYINVPGRVIGAMPRYGVEFVTLVERETPAPRALATSVQFNGHTYILLTSSTWLQAQAKATSMGLAMGLPTHLVRIDSAEEQAFVLSRFAANQRVWIEGPGRFVGTMGSRISGLVEVDGVVNEGAISVTPADAGTLSATAQANLFSSVGADVTPVANDAPTAAKKASWGQLKARYR